MGILTSEKTFSQREENHERKNDHGKSSDDALKHNIWNVIFRQYLDIGKLPSTILIQDNPALKKFFESILYDFFKIPADTIINGYLSSAIEETRELYYNLKWYEMYDFIEFLVHVPPLESKLSEKRISFVEDCNNILDREHSKYRLVDKKITKLD